MRFRGFKKSACLVYMWGEIMLLSVVCLPVSCGIFEVVKPFTMVAIMFSP